MVPRSLWRRLVLCFLLAISGCLSVPTRRLDWAINDINDSQYCYLMSGDNYYKLDIYLKEKESGKVSDLFLGLPSGIQAATYWPGLDKYYFFKDGKYYYANNFGDAVTGPFESGLMGEIFTRPIDAATTFRGKTYFFQEGNLYEFQGDSMIRRIQGSTYRLPWKMDAGITLRGRLFFFEEDTLWLMFPYHSTLTVRNVPVTDAFSMTSIVIG